MRVLVVEDDRETAQLPAEGAEGKRPRRRSRRGRRDGALARGGRRLRRADRRPHAAAPRRPLHDQGAARQGHAHARADPVGAGRGRRPRQGLARRRRRLPDKALCLLRAAGARRSARAPRGSRGAGDALCRRRPGARPSLPPRDARRRADPAAAARVSPARIPDEARRSGRDAHHAARARLGLSLRSRKPTSSTCTSRGCAPRSTRTSTNRFCTPCAGAGYTIRDGPG